MMERNVFVPNGDSRKDTATLLVGTAEEFGLSQRSILVRPTGFYITEELADAVYGDEFQPEGDDTEQTEAEKPAPAPTKTSGNRAAKTDSKKKE